VPLDIDEDGQLDILHQKIDSKGFSDLEIIFTNEFSENFFIKAMMLYENNKKLSTGEMIIDDQSLSYDYFGDTVIGATFRFIATAIDDKKQICAGS